MKGYKHGFFLGASFCTPLKGKDGKADTFAKSIGFTRAKARAEEGTLYEFDLEHLYKINHLLPAVDLILHCLKYAPQWVVRSSIGYKPKNNAAYRALPASFRYLAQY